MKLCLNRWLPSCRCGVKKVNPGVIFDPFGGVGTTALVADRLGHIGISMDLSLEYGQLGRQRIVEGVPLFMWAEENDQAH